MGDLKFSYIDGIYKIGFFISTNHQNSHETWKTINLQVKQRQVPQRHLATCESHLGMTYKYTIQQR